MRVSHDERRHAACDVFGYVYPPVREVNVVTLYPGSICAWHRHERQWDCAYVVSGVVRFARRLSDKTEYLTTGAGGEWSCPAGFWHGYECIGTEPAIIVYGLSEPYNPDDEQRRAVEPGDFPHTPR